MLGDRRQVDCLFGSQSEGRVVMLLYMVAVESTFCCWSN